MSSIDAVQLGGARRKNGHKSNCACHICENMKKKAQRHGYKEEIEKEQEKKMGGPKKKNGHRMDCACPICKNMQGAKKKQRGGDDEDSEVGFSGGRRTRKRVGNGHKASCGCPICKNMKKKRGGKVGDYEEEVGKVTPASPEDYDEPQYEEPQNGLEEGQQNLEMDGGRRTRKSRHSRKGRKTNSRKHKKTKKHHRRR